MAVEPGREYNLRYGLTLSYGFHETQPTLYLRHQPRRSKKGFVFGVTLDNAHHYRHDDKSAWDSAVTATTCLSLNASDSTVVAYVGSVIEDHLDELLHLPPPKQKSFADELAHAVEHYGLTAKVDGETVLGG